MIVNVGSHDGMYRMDMHFKDILKMNHVSFDETVFTLTKAIKLKYLSIENPLDSDRILSRQMKSLDVTFRVWDTHRTFDRKYKKLCLVTWNIRS